MLTQTQEKSLSSTKISVYIRTLQENESFWNSLIVFLGALAILSSIPFYPIYLVPLLSLLCGLIAYKTPYIGTILSVLLAFPAFAYQSPEFGFLFLLILAIVFFEAFEHWQTISILEFIIFLPFASFPFSILGGFTMLALFLLSLYSGSAKTLIISIPSIFIILFLYSVWGENHAFFLLNENIYIQIPELQRTKPPVDIFEIPAVLAESFTAFFSFKFIHSFNAVLENTIGNIFKILFNDIGLLHLLIWSFALYIASSLPGKIKKSNVQFLASFVLLGVQLFYLFISYLFNYSFNYFAFVYAILSIFIVKFLEDRNIMISRERILLKKEKLKQFSKFGAKDLSLEGKETFASIGGYDDVKEEIREAIILPLSQKELAYAYNLKPPKGILLFGPPGTGKTMLIRALANEIDYRLYYVNTSELLSKWFGESEKNISELFNEARKNAPCIIMFDEIDAIGRRRDLSTDDVSHRILSVLLQEIDGAISYDKPIIIVGTTNVPHELDPALLRPGRFDKIIYMPLPDLKARKEIFKVHVEKYPHINVDYDLLAEKSDRFSGADIKNVVEEAVKLTAKEASQSDKIIPLTTEKILKILSKTKPSVSLALLEEYERFKVDFERRVGKAEEKKEEEKEVRWSDVAGLDEVKEALLDAIEIPLLHSDLIKEYKIKPSRGILLFGPPGCGKTLIIKAAANELKVSFFSLSGAELMKKGYTQAVTIIKEAFLRAKENKPSILFIDEIETIAPARSLGGNEIVGQLLTEMDGIKGLEGVMVIGATNRPSVLDPALLRPGRFDKIFYIPPPDFEGRKQIFKINLGKFAENVDLDLLASVSEGFSGADISSIVQTAKMNALKRKLKEGKEELTTAQILEIINRRKPSITKSMLKEFEEFMLEYGERK